MAVIDDAWLEAMLDARPLPIAADEIGAGLAVGFGKLASLQQAFSALQWAELDTPGEYSSGQFNWRHLVVLEALDTLGAADVFRAYDPMLQREVALKLRRVHTAKSFADTDAEFIAKASRLAQVRHPNMLAVHGAALDQGRAGFWMDLIEGETLAARVERLGFLTPDVLLQLLTELTGALVALHGKSMAHGAVRAENIRCETGSTTRFVLMDIAGSGEQTPARSDTEITPALSNAAEICVASSETLEMTESASPAADIAALAAVLMFAASGNATQSRSAPLSSGLRELLRNMQHPDPELRPSAQAILASCHTLLAEPERQRRRRLRTALMAALIGGVVASAFALLYALHTRSLAQTQRDQARATRDFLLAVLRSPNPTQNPNAAHGVVQVFEQAVAAVPKAFSNDAKTAALLLVQFGRALQASEQHDAALAALAQADQLLAQAGAAPTDASRLEANAFMVSGHRALRHYDQSLARANAQAALCAPPSVVAAADCLSIFNDQILAQEPRAPLAAVLDLVTQNLARADAAGVSGYAQRANSLSMLGLFQRELGQSRASLASYLALSQSLLATPSQPGLGVLNALGPLALSADELSDVALARTLNDAALAGLTALYGTDSRRTVRLELQAATLALHANDVADARARVRRLLALPKGPSNATWREQARLLSALAGDAAVSDKVLAQAERSRQAALGDAARSLAEFRLGLAAVALKRNNPTLATQLLAKTKQLIDSEDGSGMRPLYWALQLNLLHLQKPFDATQADALQRQIDGLLLLQGRQLFDPVRGVWLGAPAPDAAERLTQIKAAAAQILARRAVSKP